VTTEPGALEQLNQRIAQMLQSAEAKVEMGGAYSRPRQSKRPAPDRCTNYRLRRKAHMRRMPMSNLDNNRVHCGQSSIWILRVKR